MGRDPGVVRRRRTTRSLGGGTRRSRPGDKRADDAYGSNGSHPVSARLPAGSRLVQGGGAGAGTCVREAVESAERDEKGPVTGPNLTNGRQLLRDGGCLQGCPY